MGKVFEEGVIDVGPIGIFSLGRHWLISFNENPNYETMNKQTSFKFILKLKNIIILIIVP